MSTPERRFSDEDSTMPGCQRELVLEDWHLLPNGKFRGVLKNNLVVEFDGHIVGRADPGVVIGPRGSRYLLGAMKANMIADGRGHGKHIFAIQGFISNIAVSMLAIVLAASVWCAGLKVFSHADVNGSHASCSQEQITHSGLYKLTVLGETLEETTHRTQFTTIREVCTRSPDLGKRAPTPWTADNLAAPEGVDRPSGAVVVMLNTFAFSSCGIMLTSMHRVFQEEYSFLTRSHS